MTRVILVVASLLAFSSLPGRAAEELLGAGATFPYPLYAKMFDVYSKEYGVKVNYQAIGSGGGIRQLANRTVDFGGTDAPMTDEELREAGAPILHLPTCLGAVVLTHNLPGKTDLRFPPEVIADIFLGKIKKWDDPRLVAANPSVKIPSTSLSVIHRSDGSGTTFVLSDYLSKVSEEWGQRVGRGSSLAWPTGLGAKGNPGVAGLVKQIPGSIGYVELLYAAQNDMPSDLVRNRKGNFIRPDITSVSRAAETRLPDDMRVSITDTDAAQGYPLSSFTWLIVYADQRYANRTESRGKILTNLLWWVTHEGQKYTEPLSYAPLSPLAREKAEKLMRSITYGGRRIVTR